jgi:hypothetical protein
MDVPKLGLKQRSFRTNSCIPKFRADTTREAAARVEVKARKLQGRRKRIPLAALIGASVLFLPRLFRRTTVSAKSRCPS